VCMCVRGMLQCALDFLYLGLVVWFASWASTHSHPTPLSLSLSLFHTHTHIHAHTTYTDNQKLRMSVVAFVSVIKRKRDIFRSLGTKFWEVAFDRVWGGGWGGGVWGYRSGLLDANR
jgi:hypothetical protein